MARHRLEEGDDKKKWGGPDLTLKDRKERDEQRHSRERRREQSREESRDDQRPHV